MDTGQAPVGMKIACHYGSDNSPPKKKNGMFPLKLTVLNRDSSTPPPYDNPYEGLLA